tara:strand:- start:18 stop:221 length:204 start_codon:yes stop_codon:yes gene_type:complete
MIVGDKVQHYGTGSIGTVIDSTYELTTLFQQVCVQWEDDLALHRDSWERSEALSIIPHEPYVYSFPD